MEEFPKKGDLVFMNYGYTSIEIVVESSSTCFSVFEFSSGIESLFYQSDLKSTHFLQLTESIWILNVKNNSERFGFPRPMRIKSKHPLFFRNRAKE